MRVSGDLKKRLAEIKALDEKNVAECRAIADFFDLYPQRVFRGCLYKRESPDFEVKRLKNTIGIEVVKATSQQANELNSELGKKGSPGYSMNWLKDINHKGKRLGKYVAGKQGDTPIWESQEYHRFLVNLVGIAIAQKSELYAKPHFEKNYFESWLVIVDGSGLELLTTTDLLALLNDSSMNWDCPFDKIYILSSYRNGLNLIGAECGHFRHIASRQKP